MNDPLLDAIVANPDDDAPRLVWADREGGERGELVVVQCALAAGNGSVTLRVRETELLARANEWIPPELRALRTRLGFRRGFAEAAWKVTLDDETSNDIALILARCSTVHRLELTSVAAPTDNWSGPSAESCWAAAAVKLAAIFARLPPRRVTSLWVDTGVMIETQYATQNQWFGDEFLAQVVATPSLAELRELTFTGITRASYPLLAQLTKLASLDTGPGGRFPIQLSADDAIALLRAAPQLQRLAVHLEGDERARFEASPEFARVRAAR